MGSEILELRQDEGTEMVSIRLSTENRVWTLQTSNHAEAGHWVRLLNKAMKAVMQKRQESALFVTKGDGKEKPIVCSGYMIKKGVKNKSWRERYFVLEQP